MKRELVIYLDVDGVLNCSKDKWETSLTLNFELIANYFIFLMVAEEKFEVTVALASTWQTWLDSRNALNDAGIFWDEICEDTHDRSESIRRHHTKFHSDKLGIALDDSIYPKILPNIVSIIPHFNSGGFKESVLKEALEALDYI